MRLKRLLAAAVFATAFGIGLSAQGGAEKAQMAIDAAEIKGDKTGYAALLTDDFTWVNVGGRLRDKKTVVDGLQPVTGTPGKSVGMDVRPYSGGAVMVFTRHQPDGSQARILRLWVQRGNQWLLAAHQGVPIGKPATPTAATSSPMPSNSGPAAELKAIEQAISALAIGNTKGDVTNFGNSVTDGFVAINTIGDVASKQDRLSQLAKRPDAAPPSIEEVRTRIYGDVAVTTAVIKIAGGGNQPIFQTIIHAKQGGKWLRAGIIGTAIATGKPSAQ